ncbi:MAG TPA: asparagine--tRNA ligase [Nitrososphaeraceae archaeon]|nr:asparagine--tRNA ligase [Nitrososphaeraceae archaeon]
MSVRCNDIKSIDYIGKQVTLRGWIHRIRRQKENTFIILRDDRGGVIQTIFPTEKAAHLTIQSSIEITGILRRDPRAPEGGYEIKGNDLKTFSIAESDFPIGKYQSAELLLDKRHLTLRSRRMISIAKIRASIIKFAREWFMVNDWIEVTAPIIVKGAVEGGSTLFKLKYFDEEVYLSQSAQLYLEAMIFCLGPVWSLTPSFRAEKTRTVRHLTEFSHLEAEAPWVNLEDILVVQEQLISYIVQNTINERAEELDLLKRDITDLKLVEPPFDRISYKNAIEILQSKGFMIIEEDGSKRDIKSGDDLNIDSERELTKNDIKPIFVVGYPIQVKPFYVKEDRSSKELGLAADMLAPKGFGEITSGGLREDDITLITKRIEKEGLNPAAYDWYLDLRKYGSVPHGGFGLGIERLIRWITNVVDIKDTVLFPRTISRVTP